MIRFIKTKENQIINIDHIALIELIKYASSCSIIAMFKDDTNTTIAKFDNEEEAQDMMNKIASAIDSFVV